jgi:hypothetical protein
MPVRFRPRAPNLLENHQDFCAFKVKYGYIKSFLEKFRKKIEKFLGEILVNKKICCKNRMIFYLKEGSNKVNKKQVNVLFF